MFVSPRQALLFGLDYLGAQSTRWSEATRAKEFHVHYGSSPLDVADIWFDLVAGDNLPDDLKLGEKERTQKGFKRYMMAHFWLWVYPKNSSLLASRFKCAERTCRGESIWVWVKRIAALKAKKILWENVADENHMEIFAVAVDGTDFKLNEWKHPTLPRDRTGCSHKFRHAAAKYEIAIAVQRAKVVHIAGPFKGGTNDLQMFRIGGLKQKLEALNNQTVRGVRRVKLSLADRGYCDKKEEHLFSWPNEFDSKALYNFKSRGRLRLETFNGRLKLFNSLSETFRHGFDKHQFVFEAVVVIVQYQMDNGSPVYST